MHTIKSAARRQAWYHNDDPNARTYNFFGRSNSQKRSDGVGVSRIQSENVVPSPIEERRKQEYDEENRGFGKPRVANTFPPGSSDGPRQLQDDFSPSREPAKDSSNGSDETAVPTDSNDGPSERAVDLEAQDEKPRHRFKLPWKHGSEDQDKKRTDSSNSKKRKKNPNITTKSMLRATVFGSWINVLLIFVPIGIALNYSGVNKVAVFVVNFVAIVPLAAMLSYATEELALYVGETLGGLLNASFGNAVELIVSIIALAQKKILIVQTSLIGSMLSNLLLVMGMCFFFGGLSRKEQFFNITVAQTASSLLAIAIGSLIIPTAFFQFATQKRATTEGVAPLSRGTAVILLVVYGCYLFFQLRTHIDMYNEPSKKVPKNTRGKKESGDVIRGLAKMGAGSAAAAGGQVNQENLVKEEDEEPETPQLTRFGALVTLACSTVLVALCAEYMVSSIDAISGSISQEFIGLILLPIVGNAAEHATAVTVAIKDKMDLAIGVAVGSSLQIALLVLPLMVVIGWIGLGKPEEMTLNFDGFQITVIFIAVILVNYLIQDGKSHWLEGVLLQATYLIIAVAAWFYPTGNVAG